MHDQQKTKAQLIAELDMLRGRVAELEQAQHAAASGRAAEQALRESEANYRMLFENNPLPMWIFDHDTL